MEKETQAPVVEQVTEPVIEAVSTATVQTDAIETPEV
jgi:hypothetical protein